jgi:uncharacterized membrane protein
MSRRPSATVRILWLLLGLYVVARVLQLFAGSVPMLVIVALHVLPPAGFALIHGAMSYRVRGIAAFVAICLVVGNVIENLGVVTGIPFGRYDFTDVMGPKFLHVPVLLGLAYVGMGYLSWMLGRLILGNTEKALTGPRIVTQPLLAACIMVAWDLSMDPIWSTIEHGWIWLSGGAYFGVPVVNFFGWYLTNYLIYQWFALYLRGRASVPDLPSGYWRLAVLFYGASAAGNILLTIPVAGPSVVIDATGVQWKVSDITGACALVSILTMGAFAVLAFARGRTAASG